MFYSFSEEEGGESELSEDEESEESESDKINILFNYGNQNKSSNSFKKSKGIILDGTDEYPEEEDKSSVTVIGNKLINKTVENVIQNSKTIQRITFTSRFNEGNNEPNNNLTSKKIESNYSVSTFRLEYLNLICLNLIFHFY